MKITKLEAVYPKYNYLPPSWRTKLWQIVVRVETDLGVIGLGCGGGGKSAVEIVNGHFRELVEGNTIDSTNDIGKLWEMLYKASIPYGRKGIAIMALSGVDLALWDLLGRAQSTPVYELLGGLQKERVRAYATGQQSEWYRDLGYTAHKLHHRWTGADSDYRVALESTTRARRLFGDEALIMVDSYMTWDESVTTEMANLLSDLDIYWFEDVLTPDDTDELASIRLRIKPIRLAGGEHEFTHHGFTDIAMCGAYDIWQPDITWCGGITAGLRILDIARAHGIQVVPHRGGEVWGFHIVASTDCENLGEVLPGNRRRPRDLLWRGEPEVSDGYLTPSADPGFGVSLNESLL